MDAELIPVELIPAQRQRGHCIEPGCPNLAPRGHSGEEASGWAPRCELHAQELAREILGRSRPCPCDVAPRTRTMTPRGTRVRPEDRLVYGVTLTAGERAEREAFARGRWHETRRQGLADQAYGASSVEDSIALDVVGAFGEYAVWRWLGRPGGQSTVTRVNTFHLIPDVGPAEVRTASGHDRNLIVRERDPQERPFILTTWEPDEVWIHGWVYGWEARTRGQRWNPNGRHEAWLVRQGSLRPLPIKPLRAGMRIACTRRI